MLDFINLVAMGLMGILPLANPLTTVVLFLALSKKMSKEKMREQAWKASLYVFILMIVAWYAGQAVMSVFGISIPGLRIAGGLIVCYIGFSMLFPRESNLDTSAEKLVDNSQNVAFVPLAMPSTAGPGTLAMIISAASTVHNNQDYNQWALWLAPPVIFLITSLILWQCLRGAPHIMKWIGKGGIDAISRIMGFLLVCMAVQFVINGVLEVISQL